MTNEFSMKSSKFLIFLFIPFILYSCTALNTDSHADLFIQGQVTYINIEGGFWAIQDQNDTYEPINLSDTYKKEGLRVTVSANYAKNRSSVHMAGPLIEIVNIHKN